MKTNPLKNHLAMATGLGAVVLFSVIAYATITTVGITVGTNSHSELLPKLLAVPKVDLPATVTFRTISFAPGDVAAWHYHPGPLFTVLTRGTVTVEDGCGEEKVSTTGQAFEEGGRVHRGKNLGTEATFAYQMFIVPEGQPTTVNIPGNERRCGPPRSVSECQSGWINFTHPRSFSNQGDCIQYINTGQ